MQQESQIPQAPNKEHPMNTNTTRTAAVLALGLGLVLTGCSNSTELNAELTPVNTAPVEVQTPAETPAVEAPVAVAAGDVVTEEQAETLPEGQRAFELADGSLIVVQADQPLPAPVRDEIAQQAGAGYVAGDAMQTQRNQKSLAKSMSQETGKEIIVISQFYASFGDEEPREIWSTERSNPAGQIKASETLEGIIANVEAFIAERPNPTEWDYVVKAS